MVLRLRLAAILCIFMSFASAHAQDKPKTRTVRVETCEHMCYGLVLSGRLIDTFEFSKCEAISGMTCHIALKNGAQLPSRVFMQGLDSQNRTLGEKRLLVYPELKAGEGGRATFLRVPSGANTVVLTGEWHGPYRDPY
jgi:hypothetical protein